MEELYLPVLGRCPGCRCPTFNKSNVHFTWREEDPNTRKILGGRTTSRRGTQQQFSVKYLFEEANTAKNFLLLENS